MSDIKTSIATKDCLPFNFNNNKEKETAEPFIKKLCEYFETTGDTDDQIALLRTSKYDGVVDTRWWAGRYIGLAYVTLPKEKTSRISIHPRFGQSFLLAVIDDLFGLNNIKVSVNDGESLSADEEWFSALLNMLRKRIWVDKCAKANRYGLPRKSIRQDYQSVSLRGTLNVGRTIMPWSIKRELCTSVYERAYDDSICHIIYEAHRILSHNVIENTVGVGRRKNKSIKARKVGFGFSLPSAVQETIDTLNTQYKGTSFNLTEVDYKRIRYKNIYLSWKPLVDFSWAVIRNQQLGYKASDSQTQCIFVDMAEIWESFLRKKLGEGFPEWRVLSIEECTREIYSDQFYKRNIIPDIILEKDGEYMVFDAKYKRMRGFVSSVKDSDVDRDDLFQIHTYIQYVEQNMGHVVVGGLLYPISKKEQDNDGKNINNKGINRNSFHSDFLFGKSLNGQNQAFQKNTAFIIDGIYCSDCSSFDEQKNDIANEVREMIKRIQYFVP